MNVEFRKNSVVEMLCCVKRYSNNDNVIKLYSETSFKRDESIDGYIEDASTAVTTFIDSELKSLFGVWSWNALVLCVIAIRNRIDDPSVFLDFVKNMAPEQFLSVLKEDFQLNLDRESMHQSLLEHFDEKNVDPIVHMIENIQETIDRMHYALKKFYDSYYNKIIENISSLTDKKLSEHRNLYEALGYPFINAISAVDEKTFRAEGTLTFYITYFMDVNTAIFDKLNGHQDIVVIYGYQMEQRLGRELLSEKRKQLFKVLSDEKRVEIIKLLSKRSWYGNELAKHLGITTATLSYHVSRLFDIDVITFEEGEKNRFYYKLDVDKLRDLFSKALIELLDE